MTRENGCRCQKCNKKVGLWMGGETTDEATHYCFSKQNASADDNVRLCEACYQANPQYLQQYYNVSKVENGTTWIPVKKDGVVIKLSYYKCLDCGNKEHPNDIPGDAWCSKCNSKGVEIFLGNDADEEAQGWHFTVRKCPDCQKDKGELHAWPNNSLTAGKSKQEIEAMANKLSKGENCSCKKKDDEKREREREREQFGL